MNDNTAADITSDTQSKVPAEILSSPALLFLYYRIEQILGIRAAGDALVKLNEHLEEACGSSFVENPAAYEHLLASREQIFDISKFLTVNETYFFREGVHFELLAGLLPEFAKLNRPLRICSAAVSTGCEAYSIAMLLDYHIKKGLDIDFSLDAFDVNAAAIETAKNARYTANALRGDGASWKYILDSYLIPGNGEYVVSHNIRSRVNFFTHNIMRGIDRQYDIIFFRNALIYFSSHNRLSVMNNLCESLFNNGLLFLGVSETSSVNHPLLVNRFSRDAFYFQKISPADFSPDMRQKEKPDEKKAGQSHQKKNVKPQKTKRREMPVNCAEIEGILKTNEGKSNAENVIASLEGGISSSLSASDLAACAVYLLNTQDYGRAEHVISCLEKYNSGTFTHFLRGELYFMRGVGDEAEKYYQEAAVGNRLFWPAFYRIAVLAAEGNRTRYEYKIKKAIESIGLSQGSRQDKEFNYECFMGGFSSDYFLRILEKKLT